VDAEERARREQERVLRSREHLRFQVFAAVRRVAFGAELFRTHPEFYEPDIFVNVYPEFVDATTALTEGQVRLLPVHARARELSRYAEELRGGFQTLAPSLRLEFVAGPSRFGVTEPVMLVDIPIGYHALFARRERD
jgi:hypothetical protein